MNRTAQFAAILLLALAGALAAQTRPEDSPEASGRRQGAGRLINPGSPAARLMLATPEERRRYLEQMPPERRERIQRQLDWFDSLPEPQRRMQIRRAERFARLSPDERTQVRERIKELAALSPQRRQAVRRAITVLQALPPRQRFARLNAPGFKARFSPEERRILESLSEYLLAERQP